MIAAAEIRGLLPHREPILLVDRVSEAVPGARLVAEKTVTAGEPWCAGRYPGLLLAESWAQSAGVLAGMSTSDWSASAVLLGGMKDVEFLADVVAGDVVHHHVRLVRAMNGTALFEGRSEVRGHDVMQVASMTMALPGESGAA